MARAKEEWWRYGRYTLIGGVLGVGVLFAWQTRRLPALPAESPTIDDPAEVNWVAPPDFDPEGWAVMRPAGVAVPAEDAGPLSQRFRLAGTFFAYSEDATADTDTGRARQAILDDLDEQRQRLVAEGDELAGIDVVRIFRDRVILRGTAGEEAIWLTFRETPDDPETVDPDEVADATITRFEDMPALETHRFGRRIADNRWIMERDELLRYADEVQQDPERMAALLLAMQPDYNEADEVAGFVLEKLGEDELYVAAGFQDGDVVRRVNSMPMTSPARAQYFIAEFMRGRLDAVVLDIERDGEEQKLIHLIR